MSSNHQNAPNGELMHLEEYVSEGNPKIVPSGKLERGGVSLCINVPAGKWSSKSSQRGVFRANPLSSDKSTTFSEVVNDVKDGLWEEFTGEDAYVDTSGMIAVGMLDRLPWKEWPQVRQHAAELSGRRGRGRTSETPLVVSSAECAP